MKTVLTIVQSKRKRNMADKKSIRVIQFSGKQSDWDGWHEKFLVKAEYKGYRKLLFYRENEI